MRNITKKFDLAEISQYIKKKNEFPGENGALMES